MGQDFNCWLYIYAEANADDLVDKAAWEASGLSLADHLNAIIPQTKRNKDWLPGTVSENNTQDTLENECDDDGDDDDDADDDSVGDAKDKGDAATGSVGAKRSTHPTDSDEKKEARKRQKTERWDEAFIVVYKDTLDCYKGRADESGGTIYPGKFAPWLNLDYYSYYLRAA